MQKTTQKMAAWQNILFNVSLVTLQSHKRKVCKINPMLSVLPGSWYLDGNDEEHGQMVSTFMSLS